MCIAIVTNSHPDYQLILLSNRDEFLQRPTAVANWWDDPYGYVLGGRDMHRAERGTWLGITKQGRIACLTNFKEDSQALAEGCRSRGAIVNSFLKTPADSTETPTEAAHKLISEGLDGMGGFSLLFGHLHSDSNNEKDQDRGLAIISNRSSHPDDVTWILRTPNETRALSNSHFGDTTWPKVNDGELLVRQAVDASLAAHESKSELIARFLAILSRDTLPRQQVGEAFEVYMRHLRQSIFVPAIGDVNLKARKDSDQIAAANGTPTGVARINPTGGVYGTQKQSVVLVDHAGKVTFFERTLHDQLGNAIERGEADHVFEFQIEAS